MTQCAGNVVVVDRLCGTGSQSFTAERSKDTPAAIPLILLQERASWRQLGEACLSVVSRPRFESFRPWPASGLSPSVP